MYAESEKSPFVSFFSKHARGDNDNPSYNISNYPSLFRKRGNFPVHDHQPNQDDALSQIFNQMDFPSLSHDEYDFVNFDGTNHGVWYNHHQPQVNPPIVDVHQVASTSELVFPTYAVGNPQINTFESAILYQQPADHCSWRHQYMNECHSHQQHINRFKGIVHHQPSQMDDCYIHQQNINGCENVVHQPPIDNRYSYHQNINGYENGVHDQLPMDNSLQQHINGYENDVHHQLTTANCHSHQQHINGYENGDQLPTDNCHSHQQHINGYDNGVHHQLPMDNCHRHQYHINGHENVVHRQPPTDNSLNREQHINGYEGGLHYHQTIDHCPRHHES